MPAEPADALLIQPADLAAILDTGLDGAFPACAVLDVRYRIGAPAGLPEYAAGHVPGAAYVDLDTALAAPPGPRGRHPLPEVGVFEEAMRAAGVDDALPVVVYDDWAGRAAARCWWLLRWAGHRDVRVLDGGWSAWVAAGLPMEEGPIGEGRGERPRGDFVARPGAMPVLETEDVLTFAREHVLVDARDAERFRGEVEPIDPVAGHIPGAVNVPTGENLTPDGRFRPAEELRAVHAAALGRPAAAYCGSGVTAAHDVLAMRVAGIEAALYPGSWSEWVADPRRPVATGPA